jgi:hypothetical protein
MISESGSCVLHSENIIICKSAGLRVGCCCKIPTKQAKTHQPNQAGVLHVRMLHESAAAFTLKFPLVARLHHFCELQSVMTRWVWPTLGSTHQHCKQQMHNKTPSQADARQPTCGMRVLMR